MSKKILLLIAAAALTFTGGWLSSSLAEGDMAKESVAVEWRKAQERLVEERLAQAKEAAKRDRIASDMATNDVRYLVNAVEQRQKEALIALENRTERASALYRSEQNALRMELREFVKEMNASMSVIIQALAELKRK